MSYALRKIQADIAQHLYQATFAKELSDLIHYHSDKASGMEILNAIKAEVAKLEAED